MQKRRIYKVRTSRNVNGKENNKDSLMKMAKRIYTLNEVFTPSRPALLTYIERQHVNKRFDRALNTPGKQVILYGYSGAGKTTMLTNKFRSDNIKSITTRCVNGMTLNDLVIDAFNQLEVYYKDTSEGTENKKNENGLSVSYFGLKASLNNENGTSNITTTRRAVELPITPQNLAKYMGTSGNCWVIEDFHKIETNEKTLMAQIMKVFMDSSVEFPSLRIIAIGAVNTAREVVQYDPEMRNRISEIEVPLMSNDDLKSIIKVGQGHLNINIPNSIVDKIVAYSSGLGAVTHQLAYLICEVNKISKTYNSPKAFEIDKLTFDEALDEYLAENSDSLKSVFEYSTRIIHKRKSENPTEIIKAILTTNKESVTIGEIIETIQLSDKKYKGNNLKKYVDELTLPTRAEILRYNEDSMSYYFSNPFIKAYFQCMLRNDVKKEIFSTKVLLKDFRETLNKELEVARRIFIKDFEVYD